MNVHEKSALDHRCYGFNIYRQLQSIDIPDMIVPEFEESENVDPQQSLFNLVFSVDPDTLLPVGDIAMLLSDKVHPDVKNFITLNLQKPLSLENEASGKFASLDDDVLVELTRGNTESIESYRSRVFDFLKSNLNSDGK